MTGHGITGEHGTPAEDGWVMQGRCHVLCGVSFTATGPTVAEARRVIRNKSIERRVQARLAGPDWEDR